MITGQIQKSVKKIPSRQGGAQSIRRTIDILRSVSRFNETGARLHQIAKAVDLPPPTVHRILTVLLEEEFLSFDSAGKIYHLGAELYSLGAATQQISLRDRYRTTLQRISEQTEDGTCLVIPSGHDGLCIDQKPGKYRIQVLGFDIGERRLLGIGAACLALLSFLPEKQREDIIAANAPGYLKYYGIEDKDVRLWIKQTRELKYANSIHVVSTDSIGVGAPIFNKKGQVVAAISMAGITIRMSRQRCREIASIIMSEIAAVDPPPN
ncbi:MAG: IclR family transcriptional regulator [Deltaproteobacteria bacterium]|uniref:IclR family transcriptional regulator n=1 Tax=Desulfobacula sp. TaxID=2593537 RepID=UPI0019C84CCE|nr:IclR family transcriptional regulator [Candidatus Desulfobacula maris]MBL6992621.1 IclR family transcriptional regulator [Desulfobacula sp.]